MNTTDANKKKMNNVSFIAFSTKQSNWEASFITAVDNHTKEKSCFIKLGEMWTTSSELECSF